MKGLKTILGIALATAGLGGAVTFGVVSNAENSNVKPAEAAGAAFSAGQILYIDPNPGNGTNWTGGYLGAWCQYNSVDSSKSDMWEEFWYDGMSGKYMIALSHDVNKITMARYDTAGGSRNHKTEWGSSVWNEGNITLTSGKNYLVATGYMTASQQYINYHLAGSFNSWNGKDASYVMTDYMDDSGKHTAYKMITTTADNVEFKVTANYNGTVAGSDWFGELESGYNTDYIGSKDGNILLKKAGTYEIYFKDSRKVWVQRSATEEAETWANTFLTATGTICSDGGTSANHFAALNAIWSTHKSTFEALTTGAKGKIAAGTEAGPIKNAHDRYVVIMQRYGGEGGLAAFEGGPSYSNRINPISMSNNGVGIVVTIVASFVAISSVGLFFIIRKKKHQ